MKTTRILALMACLALAGCGEDAGGGGGGDNNSPANNDPGAGPANEVDAEISGGSASGPVEGESKQSMQGQYHGAVNGGQLIVSLASTDATIIFFDLDTAFGQIPGSFEAGADLDGAAF